MLLCIAGETNLAVYLFRGIGDESIEVLASGRVVGSNVPATLHLHGIGELIILKVCLDVRGGYFA